MFIFFSLATQHTIKKGFDGAGWKRSLSGEFVNVRKGS